MATERKIKTMQLQGNDYAKVAERLKEFRSDWKDSKIETDDKKEEDGTVEFKAWIWKDKTELLELMKAGVTDVRVLRSSADADGNAKGRIADKKAFEKLQTIAVGRALANLGYLGSGDIASFEEMQEYYEYKEDKQKQAIADAVAAIGKTKTIEELRELFMSLDTLIAEPDVVSAKDKRKAELSKPTKPTQTKKEPVNDSTN